MKRKLLIIVLLFSIILNSCSNSNKEAELKKENSTTLNLTKEEKRYISLSEIKYSYQLDSLLEESNVFQMKVSTFVQIFGFDDVYKVKNDSLMNRFGVIFSETTTSNKLIFDLIGSEQDIQKLLSQNSLNIKFKINSFKKINYNYTNVSEVDDNSSATANLNDENMPFYIKGEIINIK